MSETPGPAGSSGPPPDEQFTVPVPNVPRGPAPTQAIPVFDPTRELPVAVPSAPAAGPAPTAPAAPAGSSVPSVPPVPPNPYAGQPVWPVTPGPTARVEGGIDPLLGQIGVALFWVTVGWWLFFLIRVLGYLTRYGLTDTILIRTIDLGAEETVVAAVLSVLAALLLLLGRGRAGRSALGWSSLALMVLTVGVAVWRLLP